MVIYLWTATGPRARMNWWKDWNDDLGKMVGGISKSRMSGFTLGQSWVLKRAKRSGIPVQFEEFEESARGCGEEVVWSRRRDLRVIQFSKVL